MCIETQRMPRKNIQTWSHPTWEFIHRLPALRGINRRDRIATAFCVLICVLPCPTCRAHATNWVREYSPFSVPENQLSQYFFNFHNSINKRLGQRVVAYSTLSKYRGDPRMWFRSMTIAIQSFFSSNDAECIDILDDVAAIIS